MTLYNVAGLVAELGYETRESSSRVCALNSQKTASVLGSTLIQQLLKIHYMYMPCPQAI